MSSQTTDTPGTTTTRPTGHSVADRSGATFQTYPIPDRYANRRFRHPQAPQEGSPPGFRTPVKTPFFRPFRRGSVAIFPHQRRRLELLYTPRGPRTNPPPTPHPHHQKPRKHTETQPSSPPQKAKWPASDFYGVGHTRLSVPWQRLHLQVRSMSHTYSLGVGCPDRRHHVIPGPRPQRQAGQSEPPIDGVELEAAGVERLRPYTGLKPDGSLAKLRDGGCFPTGPAAKTDGAGR